MLTGRTDRKVHVQLIYSRYTLDVLSKGSFPASVGIQLVGARMPWKKPTNGILQLCPLQKSSESLQPLAEEMQGHFQHHERSQDTPLLAADWKTCRIVGHSETYMQPEVAALVHDMGPSIMFLVW